MEYHLYRTVRKNKYIDFRRPIYRHTLALHITLFQITADSFHNVFRRAKVYEQLNRIFLYSRSASKLFRLTILIITADIALVCLMHETFVLY